MQMFAVEGAAVSELAIGIQFQIKEEVEGRTLDVGVIFSYSLSLITIKVLYFSQCLFRSFSV